MELTRCKYCSGSGRMMGGGMLMKDCDQCNGKGKIEKVEIDLPQAKKTDGYKNAKKRLKESNKSLSDTDAEKILDTELQKEL